MFQFSEEDKAAIARVYNLVLDIQHEMTGTARLQSNITGDDNWLSAEELSETEAGNPLEDERHNFHTGRARQLSRAFLGYWVDDVKFG